MEKDNYSRMNVENNTVCRLCLKTPLSEFTLIGETAKEVLDVLLVNLNLDLSDTPLMCRDCTETVKRSLTFKSLCLNTEKNLIFCDADEHKHNANSRDVDAYNSTNDINHDDCRFCMKRIDKKNLVPLHILIKEKNISYMVKKYMFQLDLNITKNPLICFDCRANMESYFKFLQNCRDTEEKLNEYQRNRGIRSGEKIILSTVFEEFVEDIKVEEVSNSIREIKEEFDGKDTKVMDLLHQNGETIDYVSCKTENGTPFRCPEIWDSVDFNSERNKIKTIPSDDHYQTVKIETEELIIKDEGTLTCNSASNEQSLENISEVSVYQCENCEFETKCKIDLENHLRTHEDSIVAQMYHCDSCMFKTKHKWSLRMHLLLHKEIQMHHCNSCEFQTKYKGNLKKHMMVHKNICDVRTYQCGSCKFQTKHKGTLESHMLLHKDMCDVQTYQCHNCGFHTKYKQNLKKHLLIHKNFSDVQVYQCDSCKYKTKYKFMLTRHSMIHKDISEVRMYQCERCKFQTKHKRSFIKHNMLMHNDLEVQMYQCDSCEFKTKYKTSLKSHVSKHQDFS